jgi:hypothetical protein
MRRVTACRELKCIREIHATLNCRPGGPQASRLKKLVNQQNKLRPEVTLTFSAPHPGFIIGVSNDYQVDLWSQRSAIDVLNDATPRVLTYSKSPGGRFVTGSSMTWTSQIWTTPLAMEPLIFLITHQATL